MTGVTVKIDDKEVLAALHRLASIGGLTPALKNIGEAMVASTQERFEKEEAPDGTAWVPLNEDYASAKKGPGMLREAGFAGGLAGSIAYQLSGNSVIWGTNKVYGAVHQFGATIRPRTADSLVFAIGGAVIHAKQVEIPARPYLGVSAADDREIIEIIQDFIDEAVAR